MTLSAKAKELSPTMQKALDFANQFNGKLARYPGGFWMRPCVDMSLGRWQWNERYFGTPTIQALVDRGAMTYSQWQDGRNGRFPVEVSVV